MKRVLLLLATNFAVLLLLSVIVSVLGLDQWLTANGIDYVSLMLFSAILGFGGAFISLLMSKTIAKWSTGAFRNSSLVAVSSGLLESMNRDEVEAVLGHEVTHVANGDMVTLTLIQGVLNTFVVFLSRVVGMIVDRAVFRTERGIGPGFYITVLVCQIVFGLLATLIVAWFSRQREFRADAGSARLLGTPRPMIAALARLGGVETGGLPESVKAFGINSPTGLWQLFATHPPIEERIAALQARG